MVLLAAACHHKPAATTPKAETATYVPTKAPAPVAKPASPNLAVGDRLAEACGLHIDNVQTAPKFDFDAAALEPADRDLLQQVATCLTTGPLHGKTLQLVGRADPRGTSEYNLGLGSRRANEVTAYLERLGVKSPQLSPTTRGALDANGTDDASYRTDRRVDLVLKD
ncbi:MAG TPA: OmpA family protein [Kofleriaceae bacterium]